MSISSKYRASKYLNEANNQTLNVVFINYTLLLGGGIPRSKAHNFQKFHKHPSRTSCHRLTSNRRDMHALTGTAVTNITAFLFCFILFASCIQLGHIIMVALCNRADHYIFMLWFVLLSSFFLLLFFPRLISAVGDWMFTILWHMVWP